MNETLNAVVIGGGQAGLATAYCLKKRNIEACVIDSLEKTGDAWRRRYDSLTLFTHSQYSSLPGWQMPLPPDTYPTKNEVADYLERYAARHELDIRHNLTALMLEQTESGFRIETSDGPINAQNVVVTTGGLARRSVPAFAEKLDPSVVQLHSADYRNRLQIPEGQVLVVGAGNSGAQIAVELASVREVSVSYERLPKQLPQRFLGRDIFWWLIRLGVMTKKADDSRGGHQAAVGAIPLIGSSLPKLVRRGTLRRRKKAVDAEGRCVHFADGESMEADAVIWATGFRSDFNWIKVNGAIDEMGIPHHVRGASVVDGLYFAGLPGLSTKGSGFIGFVKDDAEFIADQIARQTMRRTQRATA